MTDHLNHPHYPAAMAAVERLKAAGWTGTLDYRTGGRFGAGWECMVFSALPRPRDTGTGYGDSPYVALRGAVWACVNPVGFFRNYADPNVFAAVDLMRQFGLEGESPA